MPSEVGGTSGDFVGVFVVVETGVAVADADEVVDEVGEVETVEVDGKVVGSGDVDVTVVDAAAGSVAPVVDEGEDLSEGWTGLAVRGCNVGLSIDGAAQNRRCVM